MTEQREVGDAPLTKQLLFLLLIVGDTKGNLYLRNLLSIATDIRTSLGSHVDETDPSTGTCKHMCVYVPICSRVFEHTLPLYHVGA